MALTVTGIDPATGRVTPKGTNVIIPPGSAGIGDVVFCLSGADPQVASNLRVLRVRERHGDGCRSRRKKPPLGYFREQRKSDGIREQRTVRFPHNGHYYRWADAERQRAYLRRDESQLAFAE